MDCSKCKHWPILWERPKPGQFNDHSAHCDYYKNGVCPKNKTWIMPRCYSCRYYNCCSGLDNLRTPVIVNGQHKGYKPGCEHYEFKPRGD